jgi:hypothetical protein
MNSDVETMEVESAPTIQMGYPDFWPVMLKK